MTAIVVTVLASLAAAAAAWWFVRALPVLIAGLRHRNHDKGDRP